MGSGWDKPVLSVVEGFSQSAFGLAGRFRRMLLKNPKVQKTIDKPARLLADKFQLAKVKIQTQKCRDVRVQFIYGLINLMRN